MKTLEMLLVTNQQIDSSQFSNWKITLAENTESAIEKMQSIDFDLIALDKSLDENMLIKIQKIAGFQQSDVTLFIFSSLDEMINKTNQAVEELKTQKQQNYSFTDNMFATHPLYCNRP
ncbi:hypothetical protein KRE40_10235 [Elizabethkingia meningoseptica]|uniref:hypothetical protein n=1 Tax=Elizabethkingia meningoseptica TaxID=238 RepID=UPI0008421373|nr:hypothetical protein [Elizabethkingia meningoseptica]MCL1676302.1 hypothetical protein [Elizabethkingia meningoseptica]MCL1687776.1 hypothetical protein [Elizabethkingia meningoseptica]MDE5436947.1 hypothetical protein [Elizabethkingia meningoseptica]MDE5491578.1 hypothetical protein [Elizabethkingia meningoseptica]MDE5509026.1 hypothetical protein [Elizabethkingia meningoseptica]